MHTGNRRKLNELKFLRGGGRGKLEPTDDERPERDEIVDVLCVFVCVCVNVLLYVHFVAYSLMSIRRGATEDNTGDRVKCPPPPPSFLKLMHI